MGNVRISSVATSRQSLRMKILLQKTETGLFFKEAGCWTQDSTGACEFANSLNALNFCYAHGLENVQLLLRSPRYCRDIVVRVNS